MEQPSVQVPAEGALLTAAVVLREGGRVELRTVADLCWELARLAETQPAAVVVFTARKLSRILLEQAQRAA